MAAGQPSIVQGPGAVAAGAEQAILPDDLEALQSAGLGAALLVPLGPVGRRDGLLLIGTTDPRRRYEDVDLHVIEVFAALVDARRAVREVTRREQELYRRIEAAVLARPRARAPSQQRPDEPVGVVELLMDRNTLAPELQEMLEARLE